MEMQLLLLEGFGLLPRCAGGGDDALYSHSRRNFCWTGIGTLDVWLGTFDIIFYGVLRSIGHCTSWSLIVSRSMLHPLYQVD